MNDSEQATTSSYGSKDVEVQLAHELNKMSVIYRNEMIEEIHGLRTLAPEETPEMILQKLNELDLELNLLPTKPSFDEAMRLSSQYVRSDEFRLRFLRAEVFDAKKAAIRLERFLTYYKDHFGRDALCRPVYMSDLDKVEQDILKAGNFQLLPCRDRAGRRIAVRVGEIGGSNYSLLRWVRIRDERSLLGIIS